MNEKYISDLASQMGIELSSISLVERVSGGSLDTHSLMMSSKGCNVSTILYQTDLELMKSGSSCDRLELRIQQALSRLQFMLEL